MKKILYAVCGVLVAFATLNGCASQPQRVELGALAQPLLVVIDDPRNERQKRSAPGNGYNALVNYDNDPVLDRVTGEIAKDYNLIVSAQWPISSLSVHCFVIEQPSADVLAKLKQDSRIKWVQPFNQYDVQGSFSPSNSLGTSATSTDVDKDFEAFSKGKGVSIVVVDTGADIHHPALKKAKLSYKNFVKRKGYGHRESHGTAVVGLIAAKSVPNSKAEVSGFASEASVHHFRGCWQDEQGKGKCNTLTLALALDAAVDIKPDLVNLSLSGPSDPILEKIVQRLIDNGSIIVTAFDEKRNLDERFPNPQTGVIFAYGVNQGVNDKLINGLSSDSLLAPAHALSLAPNGEYDVFTGHSIATPHLTALAANYIADNHHSNHGDMVKQLKQWLTTRYSNL